MLPRVDQLVAIGGPVEHRQVPEVEVECPQAERGHRVGQRTQPVDHLDLEHRLQQRPREPQHHQQGGDVADQEVLRHVGGEDLVADLVHRRAERHEQHQQAAREAGRPPAGHAASLVGEGPGAGAIGVVGQAHAGHTGELEHHADAPSVMRERRARRLRQPGPARDACARIRLGAAGALGRVLARPADDVARAVHGRAVGQLQHRQLLLAADRLSSGRLPFVKRPNG